MGWAVDEVMFNCFFMFSAAWADWGVSLADAVKVFCQWYMFNSELCEQCSLVVWQGCDKL